MTEERLTPFMLFYCEVRDKVEKESPKLQPHEVSSEIARRWKALPADQSRAYSVLSATYAEQKKFQKDTPKVPPSPKPVKKRKERYKDPRAPKSATSAYMYFSKHHRTLLKREREEKSMQTKKRRTKQCKCRWLAHAVEGHVCVAHAVRAVPRKGFFGCSDGPACSTSHCLSFLPFTRSLVALQ